MSMKLQTVKKRIMATCMVIICFAIQGLAQSAAVGDAALVGTIAAGTSVLGNELSRTNSLQSATLGQNTVITGLLNNIQNYEQKMYNYMSEAQSIVTSAYTVMRCLNLGSDIISELNACRREAMNHPEGLLVSSMVTNQYSEITQEAAALVSYIAPLVQSGGEKNLMNSAERISILNSVSSRLFSLYASVNRLKQNIMRMRWSHLVREISPELYYEFMNTHNAYDIACGYIDDAARTVR